MFSWILALALLCAPLTAAAQEAKVIIATDLHYISPALTDGGEYFTRMVNAGDGKVMAYSEELVEAFVQQAISEQPDALILSGDLTFNGAKRSHEDLAAKLKRVKDAGIAVYALPGNHDLYSGASASFAGNGYTRVENTSMQQFESIYRAFGFDTAFSRDVHSLSYITQLTPGVRLLMLDVNTRYQGGAVAANTFLWLEDQLKLAQQDGMKVISVTHQNLYAHSPMFSRGFVISNADRLRALYAQYGVAINFSGHMHIHHSIRTPGAVPEIANSALSVSPCQYGVLTLGDHQADYITKPVDVSAWAAGQSKTDENLLDFAQYAYDFFAATASGQAAAQLQAMPNAEALEAFLIGVNVAYFSGRLNQAPRDPALLAAWEETGTFFGAYLKTILGEEPIDHTKMRFAL